MRSLATVLSSTVVGVEAVLVEVEVDIAPGLPRLDLVGLPDGAVRESKERVRAALKNSGYDTPARHITVNLAPADLRKDGGAYDLPIAVAILAASGIVPTEPLARFLLAGELSLDGRVRSIRGALPLALLARIRSLEGVLLPSINSGEAAVAGGIRVIPVDSIAAAVTYLRGENAIHPVEVDVASLFQRSTVAGYDLSDVKGQEHAKRALEVAAAGGHNLLMIGPPGSGKTMLARRLPSILPSLTWEEALETTRVHSVLGRLAGRPLVTRRPFRAPHHTISDAGLVGGGTVPRPGEISLAHNGVLFLDELPEFRRNVIELLRQPLEEHCITIARAGGTLTFPARTNLVAAMNPCPCGFFGDPHHECLCPPPLVHKYRARISGPLLDRIDIQIDVPGVPLRALATDVPSETSSGVRDRVAASRERQLHRFRGTTAFANSQMAPAEVMQHCRPDAAGEKLLESATMQLGLSARAYHRILKVARTIADLAGEADIRGAHIAEAIQYRALDRLRT